LSTESLADSTSCRFFSVEGAIRKPVRKFPRRKHEQMVHTRLDELETAVGRGTLYQCRVTTARLAPVSLTFHADISGTAYLAPIQPRLGPPHADASLRRLRRYQPNAPEWSIKTRDATTACWPGVPSCNTVIGTLASRGVSWYNRSTSKTSTIWGAGILHSRRGDPSMAFGLRIDETVTVDRPVISVQLDMCACQTGHSMMWTQLPHSLQAISLTVSRPLAQLQASHSCLVCLQAVHPKVYTRICDIQHGRIRRPPSRASRVVPQLHAECIAYEEKIKRAGGIELFLGGIGPDGHIAFNEPGSSLTSRTRVKTLAYDTIVANSRFFGGDIAKVPRMALTVGVQTHSRFRNMHPHAMIVADDDATLELQVKTVKYFKSIEQVASTQGFTQILPDISITTSKRDSIIEKLDSPRSPKSSSPFVITSSSTPTSPTSIYSTNKTLSINNKDASSQRSVTPEPVLDRMADRLPPPPSPANAKLSVYTPVQRPITPELVPDRMSDRLPRTPEMRAVTPELVPDRMADRLVRTPQVAGQGLDGLVVDELLLSNTLVLFGHVSLLMLASPILLVVVGAYFGRAPMTNLNNPERSSDKKSSIVSFKISRLLLQHFLGVSSQAFRGCRSLAFG
ncbi:glucosamine-6-phosphate isomerase, partial [Aureobasidium melanogenum]